MVFTLLCIIVTMILGGRFAKTEKSRNIFLLVFAWSTVIIHYSRLWVDYFQTGTAEVLSTMLLPVFPCNIAMWLLLICALWKNRQHQVWQMIAEFTFYLGIVGGIVGIMFNEVYASNPNLGDWHVLSGLLSHTTLICGCLWLLIGRYIKIRVRNTCSVFLGMLFLLLDGGIVIGLHKLARLSSPNCMYLLELPFPDLPWINTATIGVVAVLLAFIITAIYEQIALQPTERWYTKLKVKLTKKTKEQ